MTEVNWRGQLRTRLRQLNWKDVQTDVRPFIEPGFDLNLLTLENLEHVVGG